MEEEPEANEDDKWSDLLKNNKNEYLIACSNVGRLWLKPKKRGKRIREKKSKKVRKNTRVHDKNEDMLQWINDTKIDIFGMCETGMNWVNVP